MILKAANRPVFDADGFIHAAISFCDSHEQLRPETGELYSCLLWKFDWIGTQQKTQSHSCQTGETVNPANEKGEYNNLTNLLMRLNIVTPETIDELEFDSASLVGTRVKYKMKRNEKEQYVPMFETISLDEGGKTKKA